jgi:threonine dehydrogenase-like Zn-dependent dehydrogenase
VSPSGGGLSLGAHDAAARGGDLPAAAAVFDLVGSDAMLRRAVERVLPAGVVMVVGEAGGRIPFGFSCSRTTRT